MNPAIWDVERAKWDEQIRQADLRRQLHKVRHEQGAHHWSPIVSLRQGVGAALVNFGYALGGPSVRVRRASADVGSEMRTLSR